MLHWYTNREDLLAWIDYYISSGMFIDIPALFSYTDALLFFFILQPADYDNMEKADILELTVSFLSQKALAAKMSVRTQQAYPVTSRLPHNIHDLRNTSSYFPHDVKLVKQPMTVPGTCKNSHVAAYGYTPLEFTSSIHAHSGLRKPIPIRPSGSVWRPWWKRQTIRPDICICIYVNWYFICDVLLIMIGQVPCQSLLGLLAW